MSHHGSGGGGSSGGSWIDSGTKGIIFIAGIFILGGTMYRSGYNVGVGVSNKILKRHDKDVRRMKKEAAKREKQLKKELNPQQKRRWPWQKTDDSPPLRGDREVP